MTDNTITMQRADSAPVEVDAEDLLEAAQVVKNDPDGHGAAIRGDVVVADDGYSDKDASVHVLDHGTVVANRHIDRIISQAEDAITEPFVEYLENANYVYSANDIEAVEDDESRATICYVSADKLLLAREELRGLIDDENVEVSSISNGKLYVDDARE